MQNRRYALISLFLAIGIIVTGASAPLAASAQGTATSSPMPYSRGTLLGVLPSPKFALDRTLYVLTDRELFQSTDAGASWSILSTWPDGSETLPGFAQGNVADAGNNRLVLLIVTTDGQFWQLDPTALDWQPYDRKIDAGTLYRGTLTTASALGILYGAGAVQTADFGENQRSYVQIDQDGGVQTIDVNLAAPIQQDGDDHFLVMTSSVPSPDPSTWDCESCQPTVGGALFSNTSYGWQLDVHTPAIAALGEMGVVQPGQLSQIGPDHDGVLYHSGGGSDGDLVNTTTVLAPIDGAFKELFRTITLETNRGTAECGANRDRCTEVRRGLSFIPGDNPSFYDIRVAAYGTQLAEDKLVTVNDDSTFTFVDGLYQEAGTVANAHNLDVDITYDGEFYNEVFSYARNASNIRHLVLLLPASEAVRAEEALRVFQFLQFPENPGAGLKLTEAGSHYAWVLDYVHVAPGGRFSTELPAGKYQVAAAILAGPLTRAEAGVTDDVILYPGISGGGLSTTAYSAVDLAPDQPQNLNFVLTDADGWACPWLYVYDGDRFVRVTEILRNVRDKARERAEVTTLSALPVVDGMIRIRIQEEKAETTYIDHIALAADNVPLAPASAPSAALATLDGTYQVLHQGEAIELTYALPPTLAGRARIDATVTAAGYYVPFDR